MKYLQIIVIMLLSSAVFSQSITSKELKEHVSYLASDELEGRKPGTEGGLLSAEYIRNQFKKAGLILAGDNGFQYFDIITGIKLKSNNHLYIDKFHAKVSEDNIPFPFSANGTVESETVYAGYGFDIEEDSLKWNDYEGINVKGKWVLILRGDPEMNNRMSKFIPYSSDFSKARTAEKKGAAGVIFVSGVGFDQQDKLNPLKYGRGNAQLNIPVIHVIRPLATKILNSDKTIEILEKEINEARKPQSYNTQTKVKATTNIEYTKTRTQNVVAWLPGTDEKLKNEYIVIGGHYDHLGFGGKNSGSRMPDTIAVHNGADDNASGIASILEIADAFKAGKVKPKRSIIFIAFGAEEMGLLGSSYYVRNPIKDLKKTYVMINLDMVGKLNKEEPNVTISGTGTAKEFNELLDSYKNKLDFELTYSPDGFGASDHSSFYSDNIPVLFFNTGAHQDYHTPFDDIETLNYEGQVKVTELIFEVLKQLSDKEEQLNYVSTGSYQGRPSGRGLKVTLGIIPGFGDNSNKGLRVDGTRKGGPAETGGMKKGDFITAINGEKIKNIYEYMDVLGKLKKGQQITVDVKREDKTVVLIIQL